jgi:hypothetical protein
MDTQNNNDVSSVSGADDTAETKGNQDTKPVELSWSDHTTMAGCFFLPLLGWIGVSLYILHFFISWWWGLIPIGIIMGIAAFWLTGFEGDSSVIERGISTSIGLVMVILFSAVFPQAREKARTETCLSNLKAIRQAMLFYAIDHDDRLPDAKRWRGAIIPYLTPERRETVFDCPVPHDASESDTSDYQMNPKVSRAKVSSLSPQTPLLYESRSNRHSGKHLALFTQGDVQTVANK